MAGIQVVVCIPGGFAGSTHSAPISGLICYFLVLLFSVGEMALSGSK